jgi:hypothetical protein
LALSKFDRRTPAPQLLEPRRRSSA